ncbi:hypothetical protein DYB32_010002 [Aphanomyces invadans]|uniref:Uncharacterized protein n=1 Tax=Aphanomyces invadans TaxID=157072 RepID=A0A418AH00_9STRA|nr:hypothetical protein DYB32_010002 [Aphanomyces invadans]
MSMNQQLMAELAEQRQRQQELMDQLAAQIATAQSHKRGLRAAAASSVQQADAIDEMHRRTSARWHAFTSAAAPAQQVCSNQHGTQMIYGFQEVPKAPTFKGSTKVQKRRFMDQYEAYRRQIHLANTQRPGEQQVIQMPLSGCIDPMAIERIAFWEIGKPSHELTEEAGVLPWSSRGWPG